MGAERMGHATEGTALDLVRAERAQQIAKGWTPEHDDNHLFGELAFAAIAYLDPAPLAERYWPWDLGDFKLSTRRRSLVKAAALIVAELERELRLHGGEVREDGFAGGD
jgi:hypothetical protein